MSDTLTLALALVAGIGLGAVFFGGLWWTVRMGVSSQQPAIWFFGSFLVRMGIVVAGLYFVGQGHWERLVACLLGFFLARMVVMKLTRPSEERQTDNAQEPDHAP